ncbi:MAG: HAMP domain-containing sensor histidine kinase [Candidatus Moraniibacteriota bacterium]
MKQLFASGIAFIRENPRIIYSLILLVFVPAAFFFNTYGLISNMEQDIDRITQRKAVLVEQVINVLVRDRMADRGALQSAVDGIMRDNTELLSIAFLFPEENASRFRVVATNETEALDQTTDNLQYLLAWNQADGIAFLDENETGRFWRVTRQLTDATTGAKTALISVVFPLADSDTLINRTVNRSYLVLIITVFVVLLIVSNQARLFGYVLTLNKLKEVDEMKDTFISMASHELRSPLTAIRGYLDLLGDKVKGSIDPEGQHFLINIHASVNRLQTLVTDILEVSRLEGNRIPIRLSDFDPAALIAEVLDEQRSQAVLKKLELVFEPGESALVRADADRFKQVMVNLVSNALKYTEQGKVTLSTRRKDKQYLITVADTGVGLSAADQTKLFQKFSRIQNERTEHISGTGLGLWITLELVRRMGGTITVESIEGVGSHFMVTLPISQALPSGVTVQQANV